MAVPGGRRDAPGRRGGLGRLAICACAGMAAFDFVALFTAHGQAHDFAEGAVAAGAVCAVAALLLAGLSRVRWGEVIGLALLATLWDDLTSRRR